MKTRAITGNAVYNRIVEDDWADLVLHLESDLLIKPDFLTKLVETMPEVAGAYSPLIWKWTEKINAYVFYDCWAFRDPDGFMFPHYTKAWYASKHITAFDNDGFMLVSSCGSCVLFRMECLKAGARLTEDEEPNVRVVLASVLRNFIHLDLSLKSFENNIISLPTPSTTIFFNLII